MNPKLLFGEVGVCMFVPVRVSVVSITSKQIKSGNPDLVFYICIACRYYLKLFIKVRRLVFIQKNKKLGKITAYRQNLLFVHFNVFRLR